VSRVFIESGFRVRRPLAFSEIVAVISFLIRKTPISFLNRHTSTKQCLIIQIADQSHAGSSPNFHVHAGGSDGQRMDGLKLTLQEHRGAQVFVLFC
jgi:hypothetical protein